MTRKLLWMLAALCVAVSAGALAENGNSPEPATGAELEGLLATVQEQISTAEVLNNPADEAAQTEDGTLFQYEAAEIYAEGAGDRVTADTTVNTLIFQDSEGDILRRTGIDTQWMDLLAAWPLENPELWGTREQAALYVTAAENGGFRYGTALRDGQRITAAEYGEVKPEGDGYRKISVTYSLLNGLVTAVRVDGLNQDARIDAIQAQEMLDELQALARTREYRAVKTSRTGTELEPFGPEDLAFSGIRYTELSPDDLAGQPEKILIDNEDGTWLMRCDGDGYEAVFRCDAEGGNAVILSYTILDPDTEGPRCVRLGDLFSDDYCRFRSEGNEMTEEMTEVLYGTEDSGSFGLASFDLGGGDIFLRYITEADGRRVELLLKYEQNQLNEIILHTISAD